MYIIGPVRTAHFGRCRSFPNRFRIRRKAAADLGGGYFFRSTPNLIAAITSISNAMVSAVLMRSPPLRENNRTALTGEPYYTRFALLCQFSTPPTGRLLLCARLTPLHDGIGLIQIVSSVDFRCSLERASRIGEHLVKRLRRYCSGSAFGDAVRLGICSGRRGR